MPSSHHCFQMGPEAQRGQMQMKSQRGSAVGMTRNLGCGLPAGLCPQVQTAEAESRHLPSTPHREKQSPSETVITDGLNPHLWVFALPALHTPVGLVRLAFCVPTHIPYLLLT